MVELKTGTKKKTYKSIMEASKATGIPYITLWKRVKELGWSISKAVNADVRKYDKKEMAAQLYLVPKERLQVELGLNGINLPGQI